jgi:acetylornithine deacetylase/succinyl-diaminopimelate desuccinylase-like protein
MPDADKQSLLQEIRESEGRQVSASPLNAPSLNIDGFASARTGAKANNVIPSTATVDIDLRLVKGLDWKTQQQRVVDYIASQGYFVTDVPPDKAMLLAHPKVAYVKRETVGYNAVRTPMDLPIAQRNQLCAPAFLPNGYRLSKSYRAGTSDQPLLGSELAGHAGTDTTNCRGRRC